MSDHIKNKYPSKYETKVILKDGSACLFRPIRREDAEVWLEFYNGLSQRTKFLRLQYVPPKMEIKDAIPWCTVDYINSFAFVAEAIENRKKRIVAVGRYSRQPSETTAEVAFVIEDSYQEKGIGTKFIEWLALVARKNGIDTFEALVLPENTQMLSVFQGYGFHMKSKLENEVYHITFPLTKTPQVQMKKDERALTATLSSLSHIFNPKSVAVIGASNRTGALGQLVLQSLLQSGFSGTVYPITPTNNSVMSVKAFPSILEVQDEIDLAVIVVPAPQAIKVADECGQKKVKGIIVISDGFGERGPDGAAMERQLRETAFGYGMRIVGPNCMGLINTDPKIRLNATFAPISPLHGNMAFISQSGALGLGILNYANNLKIGFSSYVSVGNRADIAATDMIQYWEKDPATKVILLYLESFDTPEAFSRISSRVSLSKPILAIKGGSTAAGSRAAMTHTGAMATSSIVSDALFTQAGIIRVNTVSELFDSAAALANQPVPKGKRVAVLTNGGGPGTLAADTCSRNGLTLPELTAGTLEKIKKVISRDITLNNPVDLTAGVSPQEFEDTLKILIEDSDNDAIITIYIPPAGVNIANIENAIGKMAALANQAGKPLLASFVGQTDSRGKMLDGKHFVPYYLFPEAASEALANAAKYGDIKRRKRGKVPEFIDIQGAKANKIITNVLTASSERPLWVPTGDMNELFKSYGIRMAEIKVADTAKETADISRKLGFPVAVKLNSSTISHKTEVRGVVLNVNSEVEAKNAFETIRNNLKEIGRESEMQGVTIQPMIGEGAEVIVGVTEDVSLGHVIMFGLGGTYAELLKDTAVRLLPLTQESAKELIDSVKMIELLKGYRGSQPLDIRALVDLLLRLSTLVETIPQITEIDLNPVKVLPNGKGYWVVDSRIMIR